MRDLVELPVSRSPRARGAAVADATSAAGDSKSRTTTASPAPRIGLPVRPNAVSRAAMLAQRSAGWRAAQRCVLFASMLVAGLSGVGLCCAAYAADDPPPPFSTPGNFIFALKFSHRDGETMYRAVCQGCHMPDAKGAEGAGRYPALAGDVRLASASYAAQTVLNGRHAMPAFAFFMDDVQVAEVVNYVRTHFGNHFSDALSAEDVKKLR